MADTGPATRVEERTSLEDRLVRAPAHAPTLHRLGVLLRESGDPAGAVRLIGRSLAVAPGTPGALGDLGMALRDLGRPGQAYLALCAAEDGLPTDARVKLGLAGTLIDLRRYPEAADALAAVLALDGRIEEAHHLLASVLYRILAMGGRDEALARARAWTEAHPASPQARHALAALGGAPAPAQAGKDWVRLVFDRSAPTFDAHLTGLSYAVPERVAALLARHRPGAGLDILDAGCGTGLSGALLRPSARRLVGVDLSPGMLAQARGKGVYDELVEADITAFLEGTAAAWDLIVAADVFIYIGDAGPVFEAAGRALRPGGWLVASFEDGPAGDATGYSLHPSGRYRHSRDHVDALLASAGLRIVADEPVPVRLEMGVAIPGRIVAASA